MLHCFNGYMMITLDKIRGRESRAASYLQIRDGLVSKIASIVLEN
jgi:hypothetical protein